MSPDTASVIGISAGVLAFAVWMLWPTEHRCDYPFCPHRPMRNGGWEDDE